MTMLKVILTEVCSLTGIDEKAIISKNRMWSIMYARYLFFDAAVRLGIKSAKVVEYIGRERTMIYPYNKAVNNLIAVDAHFREDREKLYNLVKEFADDDTA
mgnify:CR=1 FL=1